LPSHKVHRAVDRLLLGREYEDVHAWMDEPFRWLGPKHRILRHDPLSIAVRYWNDPDRALSAFLHIATDGSVSKIKTYKYRSRARSR
jgi:hypothetical protein